MIAYQQFQNDIIEVNNNNFYFILDYKEDKQANHILYHFGAQTRNTAQLIRTSTQNDIKGFIGVILGEVNGVNRVMCKHEGNILYTWVIINKRDLRIINKLYSMENNLIDIFPEFDFDFNTIYANGHDINSLIDTTSTLVYPYK